MAGRQAVVGREQELGEIEALVADGDGARAVLFEGEAGIGKTRLWEEGVRLARERGFHVLVARPAEAEAGLPYVALVDLLEPLHARGAQLSRAHADALDAVLAGEPADAVHVARAALALLRAAAAEARVALALDDVQWLDGPSEAAMAFVVRRLGELPVRLLLARRADPVTPVPLGLDRELRERLVVCPVGPLPLAELDRLLAERLALRLARPRLERLHRACGGNPLYALEIASLLADADGDDATLPLPPRLLSALEARVASLPEAARAAALLAASCLRPTAQLVERAAGGSDGLAEAVACEVLQVEGRRLRFPHPLLAEATYAAALPWERRQAHARLAAVAETRLERAHQLARSVTEPDEAVAAELDAAAEEAAARAVPATAAQLAAAAARLSSTDASRNARAIRAAEFRVVSGDPEGARSELERLAAELPPGATRGRVLALIGDLLGTIDPERSLELQHQALVDAGEEEPALGAEVHLGLATTTWNLGRLRDSTEHMRSAVALAERAGADELLAMSLGELLHCEMVLGLPFDERSAARALELEARLALPAASYFRPSISLAVVYTATDRLDEARRLLDGELARIEAAGDEAIRWGVLSRISELELRVGNLAAAVTRGREAVEAARLLDHTGIERFALLPYAAALARTGRLAEARTLATEALAQSDRVGSRLTALRALGTLGFCALSEERADEAWATLEPAVAELAELGVGELSIFGVAQDAIEALVALRRFDEAAALAEWVDERGAAAGRAWHRAIAARGRALVAASEGEPERARTALAHAFAAHAELAQPFELARTLLVQGQVERRAKQRAAARAALTEALELFDNLGAPLWAERAAAELARIPGRAPSSGGLSETERRIAELVARGLSNKEVAAKLFVTVRTVEANLSKVYAKLGVRSRSELASSLHAPEPAQNDVGFHD
ncbi:MAG TPA: LuxR family transcriptional regulator [Gaiellaceae bacterium]|nr:LuxR family transcriptional regulator [Gaiellaceae bacterium]